MLLQTILTISSSKNHKTLYNKKMQENIPQLAKLLRSLSLSSTTSAGSGHPTSCLSAADLMAVLFEKYFTYNYTNPLQLSNDRLVFSKGHAAPLFYALYAVAGAIPLEELSTLRKISSRLEGHPTSLFPYTDAATGSLGQGLSVGAGMAYDLLQKFKFQSVPNVYVLLGDGELAEGQIWEAANFSSHYKLKNLIAIADINRLAQSQETMFGHRVEEYQKRFEAFGWDTHLIDGHNIDDITSALESAHNSQKPTILIAKTQKGHGISFLQDKENWHGKALNQEELQNALSELGEVDSSLRFSLRSREELQVSDNSDKSAPLPQYEKGEEIATREVYGKVLANLAMKNNQLYALDADVKNSTFSIDFFKMKEEKFIECFIAEQNMVSVAVGLSRLGNKPFVSTFAAFLTRAADQIRMAVLSHASITFVGSHAGVSIGEDGVSQMGLEDIALFRALPDTIVLQPSDAVSMTNLLEKVSMHKGISYVRTLRPKTKVLYSSDEDFSIGGSSVLKESSEDMLTVAASGITVSEALKAAQRLEEEGIKIRIIDCYSIKPLDTKTLENALTQTSKKIVITVEDHFINGGLGDAVLSEIGQTGAKVYKLGVTHISHSGKKDELMKDAQIDSDAIISLVKSL